MVIASLYTAVSLGLGDWVVSAGDRAAAALGFELDMAGKLQASGAAKEGSRWAMTMALFAVAPTAPITFPLYISGTLALARWQPFIRLTQKLFHRKP